MARFWLKALVLAMAVGAFLAFVGAFGSEVVPPLPRYAEFTAVSIATMATAFAVLAALRQIPGLAARRWLFQVAAVAAVTPATALVAWGVASFTVMGGPKPAALPDYLAGSLGMTLAMSALSQLVFRRKPAPTAAAAAASGPAPAQPVRFLERLPAGLRGAELWAVQAEDHYVRLHTSKGSTLILLRLADAAAELEGMQGARVHRSWWVARSAVAGTARRGAQTVLQLPGGIEAPVSRSQVSALRRAGWW